MFFSDDLKKLRISAADVVDDNSLLYGQKNILKRLLNESRVLMRKRWGLCFCPCRDMLYEADICKTNCPGLRWNAAGDVGVGGSLHIKRLSCKLSLISDSPSVKLVVTHDINGKSGKIKLVTP